MILIEKTEVMGFEQAIRGMWSEIITYNASEEEI